MKILNKNFYVKHITLVALIGSLLLFFVFIFLKIYTHHGQALSVPDLSGMLVKEAGEKLEENKLRYEVIDSVYVLDFKKGAVVDQTPKPEFKVKKNRKIFLTINAHTAENVIMPNVVGFSYRQASAELIGRGLELGRLIYRNDIARNMVLQQYYNGKPIPEGDTIIKGAKIDLIVGNGGSDEKVNVPDLIEKTYYQSKHRLNELSLNLGAGIFDNSVQTTEDSLSAQVFKQKPEPNSKRKVNVGSFVDIWLTVDSTKLPGYDSLLYLMDADENNVYEAQ